ncbi:MAG: GntR family transcriptional regulator, partial [Brachybacterium sp.]
THRMRQTWSGGPETFDGHTALHEHGLILEKVRQHNHDGALQALTSHLDGVLARSLTGVEERARNGAE